MKYEVICKGTQPDKPIAVFKTREGAEAYIEASGCGGEHVIIEVTKKYGTKKR